jgi:large subunit ribosomal protein L30
VEFQFIKFLKDNNLMLGKIQITQIKSAIKRPVSQKRTIKALGLGKINKSIQVYETLQIKGMIQKVSHLIKIKLL